MLFYQPSELLCLTNCSVSCRQHQGLTFWLCHATAAVAILKRLKSSGRLTGGVEIGLGLNSLKNISFIGCVTEYTFNNNDFLP